MKKLFASLFVAAGLATFTSCESEEILPTANVDTFVVARESGETTVYGLAMYAYANTDMTSVVADGPNSETYNLKAYSSYLFEYYWETELEDYTESVPMPGSFTFDIVFKGGETQTSTETLTSTVLAPPSFTTCEWDDTYNRINVAWDETSGTDYSVIVLRDSDGDTVWLSSSINSGTDSGYINSSSGWLNGMSPVSGQTYTVELSSFILEDSSSSYIQAKAITSQTLVWGGDN